MFRIITDTSANLPTSYLKQHDIAVIAFPYYINGIEHRCVDTESFDAEAFYQALRNGTLSTTSQITPTHYLEAFEPFLKQGEDLLFISMSSGISGSFASAGIAARQLQAQYPNRQIYLLDTRGASLGEGLIVHYAQQMKQSGQSLSQMLPALEKLCDRMCQVFTVDDIRYLRRTGRCSNIAAAIGIVLQVKAMLKGNENGQIVTFAKLRGRSRAIAALVEKYRTLVQEPEKQIVGIAHAGCKEDAETLAALLRQCKAPKDIWIVDYEPVTGSHVGPGTLALFFLGNEDVRFQ